jgi:hypothetical protein
LIVEAACLYAQDLPGANKITSDAKVDALIEKSWRETRSQAPIPFQRLGVDSVPGGPPLWVNVGTI